MRLSSSLNQTPKFIALLVLSLCAFACRSQQTTEQQQFGIVVVNAPAAGQVRRVLVSEGAQVSAGTPLFEIVVQQQSPAVAPSPGETAEGQAVRRVKASEAEIESARAEVVKHEAEVSRLTPLVASGQATQAELDGERALYERAQQRLQQAQDASKQAETGLLAARQPGIAQNSRTQQAAPREQIVLATASAAGTVSVISARAGERVTSGQPLATLRTDAR